MSPSHPWTGVRCPIAGQPPAWEDAPKAVPDWNLFGQPKPDVEFDQRVAW
jgi:hypothetical protein